MTEPWSIATPLGAARLEVVLAIVSALVLTGVLALVWRRRHASRRADSAKQARAPAVAARSVRGAGTGGPRPSSLDRFRAGLDKTRAGLLSRIAPVLTRRQLDASALEQLEAALLAADVGAGMTARLIQRIGCERDEAPRDVLAREIARILGDVRLQKDAAAAKPRVIMVVGVNGVGKTTSIGKLAARYAAEGKSVMVVAADTFRAAANEQLQAWAERTGAMIVRQQHGADPGAVVYDGMRAAIARDVEVVIVDTAGRLHTKTNLMDELRKVRRVIARELAGAPHETLLVLDAVTGQNGLAQARAFLQQLEVDGIILTKLDGTAKGGVVIAIAGELGIPIRYVGIGEGVDDLRPFDPDEFVTALLPASDDDRIP